MIMTPENGTAVSAGDPKHGELGYYSNTTLNFFNPVNVSEPISEVSCGDYFAILLSGLHDYLYNF